MFIEPQTLEEPDSSLGSPVSTLAKSISHGALPQVAQSVAAAKGLTS